MATDTRHNGWKNYETWAIHLWMDNEQGSQEYFTDLAQTTWDDSKDHTNETWTRSEYARFTLADLLKEHHEDAKPDVGSSVWADLINAALSEVDWDEIADHLLDDCQDDAEEPEDGEEATEPEKYQRAE